MYIIISLNLKHKAILVSSMSPWKGVPVSYILLIILKNIQYL